MTMESYMIELKTVSITFPAYLNGKYQETKNKSNLCTVVQNLKSGFYNRKLAT
jgi:hypothetical protein